MQRMPRMRSCRGGSKWEHKVKLLGDLKHGPLQSQKPYPARPRPRHSRTWAHVVGKSVSSQSKMMTAFSGS